MSEPGAVRKVPGDVVVRTRAGRVYVLRVDVAMPWWMGDDCRRQDPVYTFRSPRARGHMLHDMMEPAEEIQLSWVVTPEWAEALVVPVIFRVREGRT